MKSPGGGIREGGRRVEASTSSSKTTRAATPTSPAPPLATSPLDALPRAYFDHAFDAVAFELGALGDGATAASVPSFEVLEGLATCRTVALEAASDGLRAALRSGSSSAARSGIDDVATVSELVAEAASAASRARSLLRPARPRALRALRIERRLERSRRIREVLSLVSSLRRARESVSSAREAAEVDGDFARAFEGVARARDELSPLSLNDESTSSAASAVVAVARDLASAADSAERDASVLLEGALAALVSSGGDDDEYSSFASSARAVASGFASRPSDERKKSALAESLLSALATAPATSALKVLRGAALTGASARGGAAASAASVAKTLSAAAAAAAAASFPREDRGGGGAAAAAAERCLSSAFMVLFDVLASHHRLAKLYSKRQAGETTTEAEATRAAAYALSSEEARQKTFSAVSAAACEILDSFSSSASAASSVDPGTLLAWCARLEMAGEAFVGLGDGGATSSSSSASLRKSAARAAAASLRSLASSRSSSLQSMLDAESWSLLSVEEKDVPGVRFSRKETTATTRATKKSFDELLSSGGNPWRQASSSSVAWWDEVDEEDEGVGTGAKEKKKEKRVHLTASTFKALQLCSDFSRVVSSPSLSSDALVSSAAREAALKLYETVLVHFCACFGPCSLSVLSSASASASFPSPLPGASSVATFCPAPPPRLRSALARALFASPPELAAAHGIAVKSGAAPWSTTTPTTKKQLAVSVGPPRPSTAAFANYLIPGAQSQNLTSKTTQPTARSNAGNMFALSERMRACASLRELSSRLLASGLGSDDDDEGQGETTTAIASSLAAAEDAASLALSVAACLNLPLLPLRDSIAASRYCDFVDEPPSEHSRWTKTAASAARALSERLADAAESARRGGKFGAFGFEKDDTDEEEEEEAMGRVRSVWKEALRCLTRCVVDGLAAAGDVVVVSASDDSNGNNNSGASVPSSSRCTAMGRSAMSGDASALRSQLLVAGTAVERALREGDDEDESTAPAAAAAKLCDECFSRSVDGFIRAYYLQLGGPELRAWAAEEALGMTSTTKKEATATATCSVAQVAALFRCVAAAQNLPLSAARAEMEALMLLHSPGKGRERT